MPIDIKITPEEQAETWLVTATPGYVLKFKNAQSGGNSGQKVFINVCHCPQLPPPAEDLDEDELAERIDSQNEAGFKIPICIGNLEEIYDKSNQSSIKLDIIINSVFYHKRIEPADCNFFRHYLTLVMVEAVQTKHNIVLNPNEAIKLTRKKIGDITPTEIRSRPSVPVIDEISSQENIKETNNEEESLFKCAQPKNVSIRILSGTKLEVKFDLKDIDPVIKSPQRLRLMISPDRVVLLLDNQRSLYDFCIPFNIDPNSVRSKLLTEKNLLVVSASVVYS